MEEELLSEIRVLRKTVDGLRSALNARCRVELRRLQDCPFLGQPVTIIATPRDYQGAPLGAEIPVTLSTTWGTLRIIDSGRTREGQTVTARTSEDGMIRMVLLPPTPEGLSVDQQDALEAMLQLLDAEASTPREVEAELRKMVQYYSWDANVHFRQAVDIYFKTFCQGVVDTVNQHDYLQAWYFYDSTVTAYIQENTQCDTAGVNVEGMAVLNLRLKNWLGPWLEVYLQISGSENQLRGDIETAKEEGGDAGSLVGRILDRVRDYIGRQRGVAGEYVGHKVAGKTIRDFLDRGIASLPLETKVALFQPLDVASRTVDSGGVRALEGIASARADLRQELKGNIRRVEDKEIAPLRNSVGALASDIADKPSKAYVDAALGSKFDAARFDGFRTEVQGRIDAKVDKANFDVAMSRKLDAARFEDLRTEMTRLLDSHRAETIRALNAKVEASTFNTYIRQVEDALSKKVDTEKFDGLKKTVDGKLDRSDRGVIGPGG